MYARTKASPFNFGDRRRALVRERRRPPSVVTSTRSPNVVMADSTKLRRKSSMVVAALDKVTTLITDSRASREEIETFKAGGVEVIVAEVSADDSILGRA